MVTQSNGFFAGLDLAPVDDWDGSSPMTGDGRPVVVVSNGVAYAPTRDALAEHLRSAIADAQTRESMREVEDGARTTESVAASSCPQMITGKPCGGALNRSPVCPSCVTGRMGYKYRYACESCGFDIVTKAELQE